MKKFTEIGNKNKTASLSDNKNDFIKNVIEESLTIENGEIKGKDVLLKTIQSIMKLNETKNTINVLETVKVNSYKHLNLEWINEAIKTEKDSIKNFKIVEEVKALEKIEIITEAKKECENDNKDLALELEYKIRNSSEAELAKLTVSEFFSEYGEPKSDYSWGEILNEREKYKKMSDEEFFNIFNEYREKIGCPVTEKECKAECEEGDKECKEKCEEEAIVEKISGKVNMDEDKFQTEISELSKLMESMKLNEEHHLDSREDRIQFIIDNLDKKKEVITKALSKLPSYVKDADIEETLNNMTDKEIENLYLEIEK